MPNPQHDPRPRRTVPECCAPAGTRRLQSGFSQIRSFLTLVEEGDPDLVALRRGLGRSTVGGHLRDVAADYGDGLFRRLDTGLVPTSAGIAAYRLLRPLMAEITGAFQNLHVSAVGQRRLLLSEPAGLPGCGLAKAVERAVLGVSDMANRTEILTSQTVFDVGFNVVISFAIREAGVLTAGERVPDRWAVLGLPGKPGWCARDIGWSELRDRDIAMPPLPEELASAARIRLAAVGAQVGLGLADGLDLLSDLVLADENAPVALVPVSLLNRAVAGRHLRCALIETGAHDPVLSITSDSNADVSDASLAAFRHHLSAALSGHASDKSELAAPAALSIRHCLSFCVLHEERNIRRAAERLCIVQPALTVQLHRIEERLGTKLFERNSRGILPNRQADRLYALLHRPLTQLIASPQSLKRAADVKTPRKLRVGLMPLVDDESTSAVSVAHALDCCARTLPGQDLQVMEAFPIQLARWLREDGVDLIVVDQPFNDPHLVFETIAIDRLAVIVDNASDLLPPGPVSLEQLRALPLVLPSSGNGLRRLLVDHVRMQGWVLQPQIEIDSMATVLSLLKTTRYATVLPLGAVYASRHRRQIRVHEIHTPRLLRHICVGRRRVEPHGEAALALIGALRDAFATFQSDLGQDRQVGCLAADSFPMQDPVSGT